MARSHVLTLRISDDEHRALRDGAHRLGTSVSDYARRLLGDPARAVVAHRVVQHVEVPRRAEAIRQARIIGRNISALIKCRPEARAMDRDMIAELQALATRMERL